MDDPRTNRAAPFRIVGLAGFLLFGGTFALAEEISGVVAGVTDTGTLRIELPSGVGVRKGDPVRVELVLPDIGSVAIDTPWTITSVEGDQAVAEPDSAPETMPREGYAAIILTEDRPEAAAVVAPIPAAEDKAAASQKRSQTAAQKLLELSAKQGSIEEKFDLGRRYETGEGVPKDPSEAFRWYQLAAEAGHPQAQLRLAAFFEDGPGVVRDPQEAAKWHRRAAAQLDADAKLALARKFEQGEGVPLDTEEADRWLRLAAAEGNKEAATQIAAVDKPDRVETATAPADKAEALSDTGSAEETAEPELSIEGTSDKQQVSEPDPLIEDTVETAAITPPVSVGGDDVSNTDPVRQTDETPASIESPSDPLPSAELEAPSEPKTEEPAKPASTADNLPRTGPAKVALQGTGGDRQTEAVPDLPGTSARQVLPAAANDAEATAPQGEESSRQQDASAPAGTDSEADLKGSESQEAAPSAETAKKPPSGTEIPENAEDPADVGSTDIATSIVEPGEEQQPEEKDAAAVREIPTDVAALQSSENDIVGSTPEGSDDKEVAPPSALEATSSGQLSEAPETETTDEPSNTAGSSPSETTAVPTVAEDKTDGSEPQSPGVTESQEKVIARLQPAQPADEEKPAEPLLKGPAPLHACDRYAAHGKDDEAVASGVSFAALDARLAVRACSDAVKRYPESPRFATQLGRALYKSGHLGEALKTWKAGTELGSPQSTAYLAILYKNGEAVEQNSVEALRLFEQAAEAGNVSAMVFAAGMYARGEGTSQNNTRAARWYQTAADRGVAEAMLNLGLMKALGLGVKRNSKQAADLMMRAYRLGDQRARRALLDNAGTLTPDARREIQRYLRSEGLYRGSIDGQFGPATRRALEAYPQG